MIVEPDLATGSDQEPAPTDDGSSVTLNTTDGTVAVEYRAKWRAVPVIGSRASAAVTGPDDTPVIVVEHSSAEGSWRFLVGDDESARALRQSLWVAIEDWKILTAELA